MTKVLMDDNAKRFHEALPVWNIYCIHLSICRSQVPQTHMSFDIEGFSIYEKKESETFISRRVKEGKKLLIPRIPQRRRETFSLKSLEPIYGRAYIFQFARMWRFPSHRSAPQRSRKRWVKFRLALIAMCLLAEAKRVSSFISTPKMGENLSKMLFFPSERFQ